MSFADLGSGSALEREDPLKNASGRPGPKNGGLPKGKQSNLKLFGRECEILFFEGPQSRLRQTHRDRQRQADRDRQALADVKTMSLCRFLFLLDTIADISISQAEA